jgi:hypothetical protein
MVTLEDFAFPDMIELGSSLREMSDRAESMEEVANRTVRHLYDCLISKETGQRACVLVRLFKTHLFPGEVGFSETEQKPLPFGSAGSKRSGCLVEKCMIFNGRGPEAQFPNSPSTVQSIGVLPLDCPRSPAIVLAQGWRLHWLITN